MPSSAGQRRFGRDSPVGGPGAAARVGASRCLVPDLNCDRSVAQPAAPLVEHFFRHESGRLVSALSRVFGLRNLDLVEDMVQASLVEALHAWRAHGIPENPSAWMHRVAKNKVIDSLRNRDTATRLGPDWLNVRPTS